MSAFKRFYLFSVAVTLAASLYPLYMGARVVSDMLRFGTVYAESYPKYIIPYTPMALALILGVLLLPLLQRLAGPRALPAASLLSVCVFFAAEFLLEGLVIVTNTLVTKLESWQMYSCYMPPEGFATRTWTQVDVLMGEYSPAFKLHFYLISVVLILTLLGCVYGFADTIKTGDAARRKALGLQLGASLLFLGLCILACFTAFYRTGELRVSPLSAVLMTSFFIVMGLCAGVYVGSFLLGRPPLLSIALPAGVACAVVLAMYLGEMVLLSGHLYRFGSGFFFEGLGPLVLAPADLSIILLCGEATALALLWADRPLR